MSSSRDSGLSCARWDRLLSFIADSTTSLVGEIIVHLCLDFLHLANEGFSAYLCFFPDTCSVVLSMNGKYFS